MSENNKKLFLLDAFALIYRAYFAFSNNHRINSKGVNTSAVLGFTNTLLEVLKKEKPSHIAVVFDTSEPTVRHVEFAEYKAGREAMPEDLSASIPYIIKLIEGFNIPVLYSNGYEADDVIGTLAKKAEQQGFTTYMMTPDKDFGQLVSDNIFIYKPARLGNGMEIMGVKEVCKKWDIENVNQLIDILGLMGDKVDNISGIPGVGEKTAIQLVKDFGSIENLIQNTDKLKGKLKEKVEEHKEKAIQSKWLATIICDVPIEFNEETLKIEEPNREVLKELFTELEFRRLAEQMGLASGPIGSSPTLPIVEGTPLKSVTPKKTNPNQVDLFAIEEAVITIEQEAVTEIYIEGAGAQPGVSLLTIDQVPHIYHLIDSKEKREHLIAELNNQSEICFDTETTGLDVNEAELVGLSFAFKTSEAYYIPFPEDFNEAQLLVNEFKVLFENENITKIGQNIKYDLAILKRYDIEIKGKLFDTMIAHFLIQPEMRHNMNVLAETYLNYSPVSIETLIGKKGKEQLGMRSVPIEEIKEYAGEDADITLQLKNIFDPMLVDAQIKKLFDEIEIPLIAVLAAMEAEGIALDKSALNELSIGLKKDILIMEAEIQHLAGTSFNVSSPKQVGQILFEVLKIVEKPKKTKTGQYATGEDVLIKLIAKHEIVGKILDYRELVKLKNTYVDTLPELVNPRTGRIHTSYNQVVAVTGRLSSDNPNLQNIPIRTERGREIRKAFIPRNENYILLSADYSQIELRIIAELSKDAGMIEAFLSGQDIHKATAAKVYNVSLEEVTPDMRRNAKMVNFGIIYGISAFGLAERLNIPRKEAGAIIENYFSKYPGIKTYMDENIEIARERGYVETIMGRRRYLRDINSSNHTVRGYAERNAINAPIQGSAADMIKIAMINIHKDFKNQNLRSKMLLQVHDELVFDVWKEELDMVKSIVENRMKNAITSLNVPMEVGMGVGRNWLEAH
ncbi:MAG: DNA polymerase I [Bacteroidetes bacterium]|nr:DNA polymerase I [Bacteroidota bacterium]